jgi:putative chitinase
MNLTPDLLKKCMPHIKQVNIDRFLEPLNLTIAKYEINTPARLAAFLAQIGHESGSLRYVEELATGEAYEGRSDLGNVYIGDGMRFKGRGLIQITGRENYRQLSKELDYDFITYPSHLERPGAASMSAGWYWKSRGLNELADGGQFELITRRINGGLNGQKDRLERWNQCKEALKDYAMV